MSEPYQGGHLLTAEQEAVVRQPADALLLVTAGAGSGKTHTLVRRLDVLVAQEELGAGEILVLSFSRAAVRELRTRLARHGEAARHVRAQTFDSWALDVLVQVAADEEWRSRSFEDRIVGATDAIADGRADHLYEELRNVVIDEVQDLVGSRRELVETLLERYDCGFTVVGDPAQAIYGFQVEDPEERAGETNRFFDWLRITFGDDLLELRLTENFRARTEESRTALPIGPVLRAGAEARDAPHLGPKTFNELRTALLGTLNIGELDDEFVLAALRDPVGSTAILSRTNGQALLVSGQLHAGQVPHRLQRAAQDRAVPSWVATLFRSSIGSVLTRDRFDELIPDLRLSPGDDPDALWGLLLRSTTRRGNRHSIDLVDLRSALAAGRLPDEITAQPSSPLVVSSFHRAKGLEFDRVIVVDPGPLLDGRESDPDEEARMLYVAMTRPRDELMWLNTPDTRLVRKGRAARWGRYGWQRWQRMGLEFLGEDVHRDEPAGASVLSGNPVEIQDYLRTEISVGDDLVLERLYEVSLEEGQSPPYLVRHADRPIGTTSRSFHRDLHGFLRLSRDYVPRNYPRVITGVHLDTVETVAGSEAAGSVAGLGAHGVWLVPRLTGLSWFGYDAKDEGQEATDD
ncbi:UvrD-helicase domain-containing protein [Streptosporangium sp. NPDC087985]|uniref:UvrD-helicase domain-containing protein n=1 Tax=Streptosporangium sp. NPDC087985 TaxID=3366196 RepID=UPI00381AD740